MDSEIVVCVAKNLHHSLRVAEFVVRQSGTDTPRIVQGSLIPKISDQIAPLDVFLGVRTIVITVSIHAVEGAQGQSMSVTDFPTHLAESVIDKSFRAANTVQRR